MSEQWKPNYYHTSNNMVCDDASNNMHFFLSPCKENFYYQKWIDH